MEKSMLSVPEYREANGNVYLTLRNKISEHSKTIDDKVMKKIENNWNEFNDTQIKIFNFLFLMQQATVEELSMYTGINQNTIRTYLNGFIKESILIRNSNKQRDKNALYCFNKG
jgi:ATP-dependent DNA helicase RecG